MSPVGDINSAEGIAETLRSLPSESLRAISAQNRAYPEGTPVSAGAVDRLLAERGEPIRSGYSSVLSEAHADAIRQMQEFQRMGPLQRYFGGGAREGAARRHLETLTNAGTLETAAQELQQKDVALAQNKQTLQLRFMEVLEKSLTSIASADPDTQDKVIKLLGKPLMELGKVHGVEFNPEELSAAARVPGLATSFMDVFIKSKTFSDEERATLQNSLRGMKREKYQSFMDDVVKKKLEEITPEVERELPTTVAAVKKKLGGPPDQLLDEAAFFSNVASVDQRAADPMVNRALRAIIKEKAAAYNLKSAATSQEEQKLGIEAMRPAAAGSDVSRFGKELYPNKDPRTYDQTEMAAINARIRAEKVAVSEQTGAAGVIAATTATRGLRLTPKERAEHVDIEQFLKTGQLVQPAADTTMADMTASGRFAHVDTDQKKRVLGWTRTAGLVKQIDTLARRAVTAETPADAVLQRGQAELGAIFKTNPSAAAYRDSRDAFLGNLSRELAAERGVLTQKDIDRLAAGLPNFGDTTVTRDLKLAIVQDALATARTALHSEITGQAIPETRSRLDALLDRLDQVGKQPPVGTIMDRDRRIRETRTGRTGTLHKGERLEPGWEMRD